MATSHAISRFKAVLVGRRIINPAVLAVLFACIGFICVHVTGIPDSLDQRFSDAWFQLANVAPSGKTILVTVDHAAETRGDGTHLPRQVLANLLLKLNAAGAARILVETGLGERTSETDDAALEKVLGRLGTKVAVSAPAIVFGSGEHARWRRAPALSRFLRHTTLTASDLALDSDARLRWSGVAGKGLPPLPQAAAWLSGKPNRSAPFRIDFGIVLDRIAVVDAERILEDRLARTEFLGSNVIIGSLSSQISAGISVPRYGSLRRAEITALATETLLLGRQLRSPTGIVLNGALLALTALMALWCTRLGTPCGAGLMLGITFCAVGFSAQLQIGYAAVLPSAHIPAAALLGFASSTLCTNPALGWIRDAVRVALAGVDVRLAQAVGDAADGLFTLDESGKLLSANSAARRLLGLTAQIRTLAEVIGPSAKDVLNALHDRKAKQIIVTIESDGCQRAVELSVNAVPANGIRTGVATVRDVTNQQVQLAELSRLATEDPLTGLMNRRAFERLLTDASAHGTQFALLVCDLDGFKQINDSLGHLAGDALLCVVARRLLKHAGGNAIVSRLGGDEFAIFIPETHAAVLEDVGKRLVKAVARPIHLSGKPVTVGVSIGIAVGPAHGTIHHLIQSADAAMYRAKAAHTGYYVATEKIAA